MPGRGHGRRRRKMVPTVYADGFASEVVAAVAEQKDHQVGELFHFAVPAQWYFAGGKIHLAQPIRELSGNGKIHLVPSLCDAIDRRILAHRGNQDPVDQLQLAEPGIREENCHEAPEATC